jgi:hypothetical protein
MSVPAPVTSDKELEDLMAELEAQNEEIIAAAKAKESIEAAKEAVKPVATVAPRGKEKPATVAELVKPTSVEPIKLSPVYVPEEINAAARSVIVNEKGEVVQPATAFNEPARPLAAFTHVDEGVAVPKAIEQTKVAGLRYFVDVEQFNVDTGVSDHNLDKCMMEQSSLYAFYASNAAHAEAQHDRLNTKFDVIEATLNDHHRKLLVATGEKFTEKMVENAVKMDARWMKGYNKVIEAKTIASVNKGLVEALRQRRDMVIQMGADRREGMKGEVRTMMQRDEREDLHNRALRVAAS